MKLLLFFALLFGLSFSTLLWQFVTDGPVTTKPLVSQNSVIIASDDGNVYSIDATSGARRWKTTLGKYPNEILSEPDGFIISLTSAKIYKLSKDGKELWSINLAGPLNNISYIYGITETSSGIYVATNNGIYALEKSGVLRGKLFSHPDLIPSIPTSKEGFIIYGTTDTIQRISEGGSVSWSSKVDSGYFASSALIDGNNIFVGTTGGVAYSFNSGNGAILWKKRLGSWIVSQPKVSGDFVYFSTSNGAIYSLSKSNGEVIWNTDLPLGSQSQMELGKIGDHEVVFIGGSDQSIYALEQNSGEIVWKGTVASAAVTDPLIFSNQIVFGSFDHSIYSYSTERACAIITPSEGTTYSPKELKVSGNFVSKSDAAQVWVKSGEHDWKKADVKNSKWTYYIDPRNTFEKGLNTISCKVVDDEGEESGDIFTSVTINYDSGKPLGEILFGSVSALEGTPFEIHLNDKDDLSALENVSLQIGENSYKFDKNLTLSLPAGTYNLKAKKIGYNDLTSSITVNQKGINPLYLGIGLVIVVILLYNVWTKFLSQRFAKKA